MGKLVISRRNNECLTIGDDIAIQCRLKNNGNRVRLCIDAPEHLRIERQRWKMLPEQEQAHPEDKTGTAYSRDNFNVAIDEMRDRMREMGPDLSYEPIRETTKERARYVLVCAGLDEHSLDFANATNDDLIACTLIAALRTMISRAELQKRTGSNSDEKVCQQASKENGKHDTTRTPQVPANNENDTYA